MSESMHEPRHLVLGRHGQGEGDLRRAAFKRGEDYAQFKSVDQEPLTGLGFEQNGKGGLWIRKNILAAYSIKNAVGFVSPTLRTIQSVVALNLPEIVWQADDRLTERDRGFIKGWRQERHKQEYPESYRQMREDPIYWVPPGGESIIDLSQKFKDFLLDTDDIPVRIVISHRDLMWAGAAPLEGLSPDQLATVNTDSIENGQIWHYTNIDPETGVVSPELIWKRSICPWASPAEVALATSTWVQLAL